MKNHSALPLADIPLFRSLPADELARLQGVFETRHVNAGEWFLEEGQHSDHFFVILQGQVAIVKAAGSAEESVLGLRDPGDFIGEMGLLNPDGARTASARATADSRLLVIKFSDITDLVRRHPHLAYELASVLSVRMTAGQDKTIHTLREKNEKLQQAYDELKAAQEQIIQKEKLEKELQVAREIQYSILPSRLPDLAGYDFGALMVPARAVGGDFYGIFPLGKGRMVLIIGDVTDKGVPAALFMAQTYALLRASSNPEDSLTRVLERVNFLLLGMNARGLFVTMIYGILDQATGEFRYVRAGHELPLLLAPEKQAGFVEAKGGLPLGIWDDPMIVENSLIIPPGGLLLLYTDGATDCMHPDGKRLTDEGLLQIAQTFAPETPAQQVCKTIFETLETFQDGQAQFDDVTLLAVKRLGA